MSRVRTETPSVSAKKKRALTQGDGCDVVQQLRMTHMQQSGIMNGHMSVCNRVLELYTAVQDLRAAAVTEGVEAARHRKQQKEELCEMKKEINEINKQMAEMKLRLKSLQKQEQK